MVTYRSGSVEADVSDLSESDYEYRLVSKRFMEHASTKDFVLTISKIQKVENPTLLLKFEMKKEDYYEKYGSVRVVRLFHGTKSKNIPSILVHNLKVQCHGSNIGHRFGAGMSFSAFSNYASHYTDKADDRQMLLCKVLVSNIGEVPEDKTGATIREPPYIPGKYPLRYDTTAKNKASMDVIVKWEDDTFIPAYVIHFEKIERQDSFSRACGDSLHRSNRISNLPQRQTGYVKEGGAYSSVTSGRQRQGRYELEAGIPVSSRPARPQYNPSYQPPNHRQPDEPSCGDMIIGLFALGLLCYFIMLLWPYSGLQHLLQTRSGGYRH